MLSSLPLFHLAGPPPRPWDGHWQSGPSRSCKVDKGAQTLTARHTEKSVRALVRLTGERLEVRTGKPPVCTREPGACWAVWLRSPNATVPSSHKEPPGKSPRSSDSVSRGVAQRKTQPVGGWPSHCLWAWKTVQCLSPSRVGWGQVLLYKGGVLF